MANVCGDHEIVTKFLLDTCEEKWLATNDALRAFNVSTSITTLRPVPENEEIETIPVTTGSVAEFYIHPMLSCFGDFDIMIHYSTLLAIPAGTVPPAQLPDEFHSRVKVYEIVDSEFPGYVYLVSSYLLTECIDDGKYNAEECQRRKVVFNDQDKAVQFPASTGKISNAFSPPYARLAGKDISFDIVFCFRCLSWPPQAADWPTRHRNYGWPDSLTVDRVVSDGCDLVHVAHRRCRQDEAKRRTQCRLSFSRAEIVLLNSWMPVQQIVYHMLRVFVKTERLTESATDCDVTKLSNYHIKTLMLWACEVKPKSWWTDDVVTLSVALLHTLSVWLTRGRCPHYFIHSCNLFDHPDNFYSVIASRLMSVRKPSLAEWFINNYIRKCAQLCPGNVSRLFDEVHNKSKLQKAVSALVNYGRSNSLMLNLSSFALVQYDMTYTVSRGSLTVRSSLYWLRDLKKIDRSLCTLPLYFTAVTFLHVASKTEGNSLNDEILDVLATTCLQSNDVRRCMNARHSSVLSLSQAAKLMKVVANNSRSTVQLIEIELSKAYLYRALRCKDSDSDSIYCLTNVYLAVLYYATGHYQTAIDHCALVMMSQDHSQCSSHVVQGELLPKIDDDIDTVLGLSVFYQYVRTAALNQQQQTQHVSVFTTELFAHYLHIKCLSIMKCRQLTQASSTDKVQRYQQRLCDLQKMLITDVLIVNLLNYAKHPRDYHRQMTGGDQATPDLSHQLDTAELVELLQHSAVEHLSAFRHFEERLLGFIGGVVTTDFEALYAYKVGQYQRCLQLSADNVSTLMFPENKRKTIDAYSISCVFAFPEFIQLMDGDIVSLIGLMLIADPSLRVGEQSFESTRVYQLQLSLYLMTQCQIKLHHPLTSLIETLDYVEAARQKFFANVFTLDQLLLKLLERKILFHVSES